MPREDFDQLGRSPPGGGGGIQIFSYIRWLGSFLGVPNFEFQYFWGFSEKLIFWGMNILWLFFGGSSQNWTIFRGHFIAFCGLLVRSRYIIGDIFGLLKFQIFLGAA